MKEKTLEEKILASSIGNMPERDTVIEQYAHEGVAHHPSDIGMLRLAERYTTALERAIADSE